MKVLLAAALITSSAALASDDTEVRSVVGEDAITVVADQRYRADHSKPGHSGERYHHEAVRQADQRNSCEPVLYVHGKFRQVIETCDGAGGTELTPVFEYDEPEDGEEPVITPLVITRSDVQSLLVNPGGLEVQPDRSWVLVNTETIVMTGAAEHVLPTQVLGVGVDVRVTPALFTWEFGDASEPVTGTDPGAPWPNHTVSHVYRDAGEVSVTLRTEWDAAFRVHGTSSWMPVEGRAVTVETSSPIEVVTATPRLTTG